LYEKKVFLGQLAWAEGELTKFPKFLGENKICNYPLRANGPKFLKNIWLFGKYGPKTWFFKANGLKFIEKHGSSKANGPTFPMETWFLEEFCMFSWGILTHLPWGTMFP
jgi:hypothetical protein